MGQSREEACPVSVFRVVLLVVSVAVFGFTFSSLATAQPRPVTEADLVELKDGKMPKNAEKNVSGGLFSKNTYRIIIHTPRGQAARFADAAEDNYIKLDSTTFKPSMFNEYVRIDVSNIMAYEILSSPKPEDLRQIERGVIVKGDDFHEIDSVIFDKSTFQNAYGAAYVNVDAIFYVPIGLFDGSVDLKLVIIDNEGKYERKIKAKDIKKLE